VTAIRPPRASVDSFQDRKWKERVAKANIPEYATDPASPAPGDVWVRRTGPAPGATYELSFKTLGDGIKRVALT
jgi:hypothetical protein